MTPAGYFQCRFRLRLSPKSLDVHVQPLGSGWKRTASDHATLRAVSIDPRDKWSMSHFSQSNPDGAGQGDVAALLRRVADSIDALGDVVVEDMTFSSQTTADERALLVTVYYHRDDRA